MNNYNESYQDPIVVKTSPQPTIGIIWLHGLGADGGDFSPIVPMLGIPEEIGIEYVFPHAPIMPITINGGTPMRAWYDITNIDFLATTQDQDGLQKSCNSILKIASNVAEKYGWNNILLAGFSQGGAVAASLLNYIPKPIAGVMCLSSYLADTIRPRTHLAGMSVLVMHGKMDTIVPIEAGKKLAKTLRETGYDVEYSSWSMEHQVMPQQMVQIGKWVTKQCT